MLIDNYESSKHKTINHDGLYKYIQTLKPDQLEKTSSNIIVPQSDISFFDTISHQEAIALFNEQLELANKTTELFLEYGLIAKPQANLTIKQYEVYFVMQGNAEQSECTPYYAFNKKQVLQYIDELARPSAYRTVTQQSQNTLPNDTTPQPPSYSLSDSERDNYKVQNTIGISRQSIRDITGYTYRPVPKWSRDNTPVFIKWQKELLEDKSDILVVDGSRQMGKSHVTAQFIVEESFIE